VITQPHILIVGNGQGFHVGSHFARAAGSLGWNTSLCDVRSAYAGPGWASALLWRCGHRPIALRRFSRDVLECCFRTRPAAVLTTGLAPVRSAELAAIGRQGITRLNFLTDDPWNPAHRAAWFQEALREYDFVFSPRRSILQDLERHGCKAIHYLPFAYAPDVHFPEAPTRPIPETDVMFAGGADADRLPYVRALMAAGLTVSLYGGYWDRYADLKPFWRGNADLATLRQATGAAKVVLCLVRRANRDRHSMRSFEAPAMRSCILIEDTDEHREMFGENGESVIYFRSISEMVARAKWLVGSSSSVRSRLAAAAHERVAAGRNTYRDRLEVIAHLAGFGSVASQQCSPADGLVQV
jgi:hypothetical protein